MNSLVSAVNMEKIEHLFECLGMYIGSVAFSELQQFSYNAGGEASKQQTIDAPCLHLARKNCYYWSAERYYRKVSISEGRAML
jgi:hypothetical protein